MLKRFLHLLGLGPKIDALGVSLDETKAILDQANAALRARLSLDMADDDLHMIEAPSVPVEEPKEPANGQHRKRAAAK